MESLIELFFGGAATWFTAPALVGTIGFLVRFLLASFGGDDDGGAGDGADAGGAGHGDIAATAISVQGMLTFLMGFGWGALTFYRGLEFGPIGSGAGGFVIGVLFLILSLVMLRLTRRLQSSGNISITELVGRDAEAYTIIPAPGQGQGQIKTVVGDRQRFVYAVSDQDEIPARTRVAVVRANGDNTVTVRRVAATGGSDQR